MALIALVWCQMPDVASYRAYYHTIVIILLGPMVDIETQLFEPGLKPLQLCIKHCQEIHNCINTLGRQRPSELTTGSLSTIFILFSSSFALVALLERHRASRSLFVQCCRYLYNYTACWPTAAAILSGMQAFCQQLGVSPPEETLQYLQKRRHWPKSTDVPANLVLSSNATTSDPPRDSVAERWHDLEYIGITIEKWNSLTIKD